MNHRIRRSALGALLAVTLVATACTGDDATDSSNATDDVSADATTETTEASSGDPGSTASTSTPSDRDAVAGTSDPSALDASDPAPSESPAPDSSPTSTTPAATTTTAAATTTTLPPTASIRSSTLDNGLRAQRRDSVYEVAVLDGEPQKVLLAGSSADGPREGSRATVFSTVDGETIEPIILDHGDAFESEAYGIVPRAGSPRPPASPSTPQDGHEPWCGAQTTAARASARLSR